MSDYTEDQIKLAQKSIALAEWYGDIKAQARLREILSDPVFHRAVLLVEEIVLVEDAPNSGTTASASDLVTLMALNHAKLQGSRETHKLLYRLVNIKSWFRSPKNRALPPAWGGLVKTTENGEENKAES